MARRRLLMRAWRNAPLRRLGIANAGFRMAELGVWIALTAYAYTAGGVREASAVMVAQLVPATGFALAVGALIRHHGPGPVLRWGLAVQAAAMVIAAGFLHDGYNAAAFAAAVVTATAVTTTRPAQSVLTPSLVDGPDDLTAANVLTGVLTSGAGLAGPAIAAVIMTAIGAWAVFAILGVVVLASAVAVWHLPTIGAATEEDPESLLTGIRATARERGPRVMVAAVAAHYFVIGACDVLAVVIAVELLGRAEAYAGYLTTAIGLGCVIAGGISLALIGRRWIAPWIIVSGGGAAGALVAVSLLGSRLVASLFVLVALGIAQATYELTALMLLQRVTRLDLVGHIFALVEALQMAMLAVGAAVVPLAVTLFGSHRAPGAIGVLLAVMIGVLSIWIVRIDREARVPITEMAALRATPLFAALPGAGLETIAREARRVEITAGDVVVQQGDLGTAYYAVVSGHLSVSIDGVARAELGRGDGFGELALIRDVPRTATVRASADSVLLAVDREPFLTAVTGHATTHDRASSIAAAHLDPAP